MAKYYITTRPKGDSNGNYDFKEVDGTEYRGYIIHKTSNSHYSVSGKINGLSYLQSEFSEGFSNIKSAKNYIDKYYDFFKSVEQKRLESDSWYSRLLDAVKKQYGIQDPLDVLNDLLQATQSHVDSNKA